MSRLTLPRRPPIQTAVTIEIRSASHAEAILSDAVAQYLPVGHLGTSFLTRKAFTDGATKTPAAAPEGEQWGARHGVPPEVAASAARAIDFLERNGRFETWASRFREAAAATGIDVEDLREQPPRERLDALFKRLFPGALTGTTTARHVAAENFVRNAREQRAARDLLDPATPGHVLENSKTLLARAEMFRGGALPAEYAKAVNVLYALDPRFLLGDRALPEEIYGRAEVFALARPGSAHLRTQLDEQDRRRLLALISGCDIARAPRAFAEAAWQTFLRLRHPIDATAEQLTRRSLGAVVHDFATAGLDGALGASVDAWVRQHCTPADPEWVTLLAYSPDKIDSLSAEVREALFLGLQGLLRAEHTDLRLHPQIAALSFVEHGRCQTLVPWLVDHSAGCEETPPRIVRDLFDVWVAFDQHRVEDPDARRHGAEPMVKPRAFGALALTSKMITTYVARGELDRARATMAYALERITSHPTGWAAPFSQRLTHALLITDTPNAEALRPELLAMLRLPQLRDPTTLAKVAASKQPWFTAKDKDAVLAPMAET